MTEPVFDLLPRGFKSEADELFLQFSQGIEEVVNFGTHILKWEIDQAKGGEENLPSVMMLRHILELADSISILARYSSIDPAKPILRALLEALLGLEYLLEADYENRSLGFLYWHYIEGLRLAKKFKPGEEANKNLAKKLLTDKSFTNNIKPPIIANLDLHIKNLNVLINLPQYAKAMVEYNDLVNKGVKNPKWYQLFNGPQNLDAMATRLKRQGLYEVLYRSWSGPTHGTDIIVGKLTRGTNGTGQIIQLRNPKDAQLITMYTFQLCLATFQIMVEKRIPNRKSEYLEWYKAIRSGFFQLVNENLLQVE